MMFEGVKYGTPIEILWGDAWSNDSRYFYPDDLGGDFTLKNCYTLGYFCRETKTTVVIGWQLNTEGDDRCRSVFVIPKSEITDWWEIKA